MKGLIYSQCFSMKLISIKNYGKIIKVIILLVKFMFANINFLLFSNNLSNSVTCLVSYFEIWLLQLYIYTGIYLHVLVEQLLTYKEGSYWSMSFITAKRDIYLLV